MKIKKIKIERHPEMLDYYGERVQEGDKVKHIECDEVQYLVTKKRKDGWINLEPITKSVRRSNYYKAAPAGCLKKEMV